MSMSDPDHPVFSRRLDPVGLQPDPQPDPQPSSHPYIYNRFSTPLWEPETGGVAACPWLINNMVSRKGMRTNEIYSRRFTV